MSRTDGRPRVAIVGGGITGLAAAHRLLERSREASTPVSITLLETSGRLGGQIRTEREGGTVIEGGPDTLLTQKPWAVDLCERLGIAGQLEDLSERGKGTEILHRGRLVRVPDGFMMMAPTRIGPALASPLFSWRGKARMLAEPWIPKRPGNQADESLGSFVRRRFGREVLDRVAEPVMAGLYTADAERMSLRMTMPRFLDLEAKEGSITRALRRAARSASARPFGHGTGRGSFVAPRRGIGAIVDVLADRLKECDVRTASEVTAIETNPSGAWRVRLAGGETIDADAVLLACPAYEAARLLRGVDRSLAEDLDALRYASCATVTLAYPRAAVGAHLTSFGFFAPRTEGVPILACSYVSEKFQERAPADVAVFRAFLGGARSPEALDGDDAALARSAHEVLRRVLSIDGEPNLARVYRSPRSMPQFDVGAATWVARVRERVASIRGLFLGGSATGAVGLPDCVHSGERSAESVREYLRRVERDGTIEPFRGDAAQVIHH